MECYHVQFKKFRDVAFFAKNADEVKHLVEIYLSIHLSKNAEYQISLPVDLTHVSRLEFYQLQAALAKNVAGCGVYDRENGWKILPVWQHTLMPETEPERVKSALVFDVK